MKPKRTDAPGGSPPRTPAPKAPEAVAPPAPKGAVPPAPKGAVPAAPGSPDSEKISKPERLLNLVAFLLSSRNAVPFSQIKGRVAGFDDDASPEALEKRFDRDKAELRSLGVPIVYEPLDEHGHEGYRIPREEYFLPEIRLSVEEAAALAVVQRYAQDSPDDPLARPLGSALRKVAVDNPLTGAAAASITEQHMLGVRSEPPPGDVAPNLEVLTDAVLRRRAVRFRYYGIGRDEERQREVEPYGLGWHDGKWYLVARDREKAGVRHFRVDRIRGRARTVPGPSFEVPEDFDVSAHIGRPAFALRDGAGGERVTVQLRPEIAFMVRDALQQGWDFRELPGGGAILEFESHDRNAVIRYVARHLDRARIVSPADLRAQSRDVFRAVLAAHEGPPSADVRPKGRSKKKGKR